MKKFIITNAIITIIISVFLIGYTSAFQVTVYADDVTDDWQNVTTNDELVEAFRYYCKSRDLTIDGSIANAVTTFTTKTFNGICNVLGIDMTAIQANIKYNVDSNGVKRFLFTNDIISTYNRIFAQFLQDNDLAVGQAVNNKEVYSGEYIEDSTGYGCFVYVFKSYTSATGSSSMSKATYLGSVGTPYRMNYTDIMSLLSGTNATQVYNRTFGSINNVSQTYYFRFSEVSASSPRVFVYDTQSGTYNLSMYRNAQGHITQYWHPAIIKLSTGQYYFGEYGEIESDSSVFMFVLRNRITNSNIGNNVNIYINSTTINNNNYEGDTIINNYGTPSSPTPSDPEYDPYPGGGGSNTPSGTIGGNGSDGTINFPDLNLNLPQINWSLGDLSQKFPFSIPFDMIAFLTLLNGEPQAPHITGSIPLTSHYTWELDLDFSQFDTFAGIMRGLEFVGFMFFLISATINIVRG